MPTICLNRDQFQVDLLEGIDTLVRAVAITFGPSGRNVLLERDYGGRISKDGVSIARMIASDNRIENLGIQALRQAAIEASDNLGDFTSTTVLMTGTILKGCLRASAGGLSTQEISVAIENVHRFVQDELTKAKFNVDNHELLHTVALSAANGDAELASVVSNTLQKLGSDDLISVETGERYETQIEERDGFSFDKGLTSLEFLFGDTSASLELNNPFVLVTDLDIDTLGRFTNVLDQIVSAERPLAIVGGRLTGEALATLITNARKGVLESATIGAPEAEHRQQAFLEDFAIFAGAEFVSKSRGMCLDNVGLEQLGSVGFITTGMERTRASQASGCMEETNRRRIQIQKQVENSTDTPEREWLENRLARISGRCVNIYVGGSTKDDIKERRDRTLNSLRSARLALETGAIRGGGVELAHIARQLVDHSSDNLSDRTAANILKMALEAPFRTIAENRGRDAGYLLERIHNEDVFEHCNQGPAFDAYQMAATSLSIAVSTARTLQAAEIFVVQDD